MVPEKKRTASKLYPAEQWMTISPKKLSPPEVKRATLVARPSKQQQQVPATTTTAVQELEVEKQVQNKVQKRKRMEGLSIPDVVRTLLKDGDVLRWNKHHCAYEVLDGKAFEERYVKCLHARFRQRFC